MIDSKIFKILCKMLVLHLPAYEFLLEQSQVLRQGFSCYFHLACSLPYWFPKSYQAGCRQIAILPDKIIFSLFFKLNTIRLFFL